MSLAYDIDQHFSMGEMLQNQLLEKCTSAIALVSVA
jgi:hypothetical protein